MGTHPIFESDFDCLTDEMSEIGIMIVHFCHGFPWQTVSLIARGVALALDYIHSSNIIHRSVRASHVLITEKGIPKLTGFRYAMELSDENKSFKYSYDAQGILWK